MKTNHRLRIVLAVLAVALVVVLCCFLPRQSKCQLNIARYDQEATLLTDGRVLVSGGAIVSDLHPAFRNLQFLRSVPCLQAWIPLSDNTGFEYPEHSEILDIRTRRWHLCNPLDENGLGENGGGVAVVLNDGRVLRGMSFIVEGIVQPKVAIFDPGSGKWEKDPGPSKPGDFRHGALLGVDKPLFGDGVPLWVDLQTGRYNVISLPFDRRNNQAFLGWGVQLDDRTALFEDLPPGCRCMKCDLLTSQWTTTGAPLVPRRESRGTLLMDGQVLVSGGIESGHFESDCEVYGPKTGTWRPTGALNVPRLGHSITVLADGRVLAAGGQIGANEITTTCEIYDPATGRWTLTGSLNQARVEHSATLLPSGQVLVVGGTDSIALGPHADLVIFARSALDSCELYDPVTGTWTLL